MCVCVETYQKKEILFAFLRYKANVLLYKHPIIIIGVGTNVVATNKSAITYRIEWGHARTYLYVCKYSSKRPDEISQMPQYSQSLRQKKPAVANIQIECVRRLRFLQTFTRVWVCVCTGISNICSNFVDHVMT